MKRPRSRFTDRRPMCSGRSISREASRSARPRSVGPQSTMSAPTTTPTSEAGDDHDGPPRDRGAGGEPAARGRGRDSAGDSPWGAPPPSVPGPAGGISGPLLTRSLDDHEQPSGLHGDALA